MLIHPACLFQKTGRAVIANVCVKNSPATDISKKLNHISNSWSDSLLCQSAKPELTIGSPSRICNSKIQRCSCMTMWRSSTRPTGTRTRQCRRSSNHCRKIQASMNTWNCRPCPCNSKCCFPHSCSVSSYCIHLRNEA